MYQFFVPVRLLVAAGTAKRNGFEPPSGERWRVKSIQVLPEVTTAANGTDYVSLIAYAGSTALMSARTTASSALTQGTGEALTLTGGLGDCEVYAGKPFTLRATHGGSGAAAEITALVCVERLNTALS
jgi:hypothetical protein